MATKEEWEAQKEQRKKNIGKPPELTEYKGHKLIKLYMEDGSNFQFGMKKATAVAEHIESIRIFVESDGERCDAKDPF